VPALWVGVAMSRRVIDPAVFAPLTIWLEARGEPDDGMTAVAEVIWTRVKFKFLSDGTLDGTVLRRWQFSGWDMMGVATNLSILKAFRLVDDDPIYLRCLRAWERAVAGSTLARGADSYLNVASVLRAVGRLPTWAASPTDAQVVDPAKLCAVIGRHHFLKVRIGP
jgi:hypothetical protein